MKRFAYALALACACGALTVAAGASPARAQDSSRPAGQPAATLVEARFQDFITPQLLRVWERSGGPDGAISSRVYSLGPEASVEIARWVEAGVLPVESWLRLSVGPAGGTLVVQRVERLDEVEVRDPFDVHPRGGAGATTGPSAAELAAEQLKIAISWARSLTPGDLIEIDGERFTFERRLESDLIEVAREGEEARRAVALAAKQYRKLDRQAIEAAPREEIVRPSDTVEVRTAGGRKEAGTVLYIDAQTIVLEAPDSREVTFAREPGLVIERILDPGDPRLQPPVIHLPVRPEDDPPPQVREVKVNEVHGQPKLDPEANVYRVEGTVHHQQDGKLLLRALLTVRAKARPLQASRGRHIAGGRMVGPEKEAELVERYGGRIPDEGADDFGIPVVPLRTDGGGLVVVKLESLDDIKPIELKAIFPHHAKLYSFTTDLLNPQIEILLEARDEDFVAWSDPRAASALMAAYAEKGPAADLDRPKALEAMALCGDPRLVSFLYYQHYLGEGDSAAIERAVVAFGEQAEAWLLGLLDARAFEKGVDIAGPDGATRRIPHNPDIAQASVFRLLAALQSEQAFPYALDALQVSVSNEVREAARSVFLDRTDPPSAWLLPRLTAEATAVRTLFLDLDARRPGTLERIYRNMPGLSDEAFENEVLALRDPEEQAELYLRRILTFLHDNPNVRLEIHPALDELTARDRIQEARASLSLLRREAANGLVALAASKPPADADHRHWRTEQLRKALVYDPQNAEARERLGAVVAEVVAELDRGAAIRSGPGSDWEALGRLEAGTVMAPAEPDAVAAAGGWLPVHAVGGVSYVHTSCARRGSQRVLAVRETRPAAEVVGLLRHAMWLDHQRSADHERRLVQRLAEIGSEAVALQQWDHALHTYSEATARRGGAQLVLSLVTAYLHVHTWIPVAALLCVFVLLVSVLARPGAVAARAGAAQRKAADAHAEPPEA